MRIARFVAVCGLVSAQMRFVSACILRFALFSVPNRPVLASAEALHGPDQGRFISRPTSSESVSHHLHLKRCICPLMKLHLHVFVMVGAIHKAVSVYQPLLISSRQHPLATSAYLLNDMAWDDKGLIRLSVRGGRLYGQDDIPETCLL